MRKKTPTNLTLKPSIGLAAVVREVATGNILRVSVLCARDTEHAPIAKFSGSEPFFKVKLGKKKIGFTYHKFLCAPQLDKCLTEDGKYEWLNQSLKDARGADLTIVNDTHVEEEETASASANA